MVLELLVKFTQTLISVASFILIGVIIYNFVIFIIGYKRKRATKSNPTELKKITLIIPVKDEINSLPLIFESLKNIIYPRDLLETIFVVSRDSKRCIEACKKFLKDNGKWVKVLVDEGRGKPSALNLGLKHAGGEIVGIFDVDSILPKDILLKVSEAFSDGDVVAVQGVTKPYNENKNLLSKLVSMEEKAYLALFLQPRSNLDLFLPFTGSGSFIKKDLLLKIGGWSETALAEDFELALRLFDNKIKIRLEPKISCQHEAASKLTPYILQRLRWFRGYLQLLLRASKKLITLTPHWIDISIILASPILLSASLIVFLYFLISADINSPVNLIKPFAWSLLITAIPAFFYITSRLRTIGLKALLIIPASAAYWLLESLTALTALMMCLFRIKMEWIRTPKNGVMELIDDDLRGKLASSKA